MTITIEAGWWITGKELGYYQGESVAKAVEEVAQAYPEVLAGMDRAPLKQIIAHVDDVNGEGNYHEFVFRVVEIEQ